MTYFLFLLFFLQNPALDSVSPKERQAAAEQMAVIGNSAAIPQLAAALKKETKSDVRASMIAALGRIRDRAGVPILADTLRTDLDKDVRLQAIDSLLRLYIPIQDSGTLRTVFNRVKSVFSQPDAPVVGPEVQVDAAAKEFIVKFGAHELPKVAKMHFRTAFRAQGLPEPPKTEWRRSVSKDADSAK